MSFEDDVTNAKKRLRDEAAAASYERAERAERSAGGGNDRARVAAELARIGSDAAELLRRRGVPPLRAGRLKWTEISRSGIGSSRKETPYRVWVRHPAGWSMGEPYAYFLTTSGELLTLARLTLYSRLRPFQRLQPPAVGFGLHSTGDRTVAGYDQRFRIALVDRALFASGTEGFRVSGPVKDHVAAGVARLLEQHGR